MNNYGLFLREVLLETVATLPSSDIVILCDELITQQLYWSA